MKWITRERPKIDRIACPWLVARFIDRDAAFLFVPSGEVISRLSALTMPVVIVLARPNGAPTATTASPTCTSDESVSVSGCSWDAGASISITATSLAASVPTTVAA